MVLKRNKILKKTLALLIYIFMIQGSWASTTVDFYATVSKSKDLNMIKMTTDLFFSQFQTLDGYSVTDRRDVTYSEGASLASHIAFFAQIEETPGGEWTCTLNAIKADVNKNVSSTKTYGSYYKILLDAKASLENLLLNLNGNATSGDRIKSLTGESSAIDDILNDDSVSYGSSALGVENNLDNLAGTWDGEDFIEKIILLRGGKGYVIFKNGASMGITVTISGDTVTVTQSAKPNASYYPQLPRQVALKNAASAQPTSWTLKLVNGNTLVGTKTTLVEDQASDTGASQGTMEVSWTKR